jgi:hypothetical protein
MSKKRVNESNNEIKNFTIYEKVCATQSDGQHLIIIHALRKDTNETVWAIGDDKVCAITREDCVRNDIPYNSVLIQEFPYEDNTPKSVGKWRPLIEKLVNTMIRAYMRHDGFVHVYPQWVPKEAYASLGKKMFMQMSEGCDHVIIHAFPPIIDFVPRKKETCPQETED